MHVQGNVSDELMFFSGFWMRCSPAEGIL